MTKMGSDLHALTKRFSKFIVNVKREFPIGILYFQCQNITLCGRGEKDRDFFKKIFYSNDDCFSDLFSFDLRKPGVL